MINQFIWILKIQNKVNFIPSKLGIGTNLCVIKPHFNSVKPSYNIFVQNTVFLSTEYVISEFGGHRSYPRPCNFLSKNSNPKFTDPRTKTDWTRTNKIWEIRTGPDQDKKRKSRTGSDQVQEKLEIPDWTIGRSPDPVVHGSLVYPMNSIY